MPEDETTRERRPGRTLSYDPNEHAKGDWFREQISDEEWNDPEWIEVGGIGGAPAKYVRSFKRSE
jgi:hypothetical protein